MKDRRPSPWRIRPAFLCFAVTLLIPVVWLAVIGGLESAGKDDLALGLGWLSIPVIFVAVPAGLAWTLVLAITGRKQK